MAGLQKNENSLLFLYEGETEGEFYKRVFDLYIPPKKIKRNYGNLKGIYNLNDKVKSKIESYLVNGAFESLSSIHVFVAYDREGPRDKMSLLDLKSLRDEFIREGSRISSVNEIVATQDLESWFFHDLENIYKHLRAPKNKRNMSLYNNVEATNNRVLSSLFHKFDKHYQKGRRVNGFIDKLDIEKIVKNVHELKESLSIISKLC
jgi:hypothetical protein